MDGWQELDERVKEVETHAGRAVTKLGSLWDKAEEKDLGARPKNTTSTTVFDAPVFQPPVGRLELIDGPNENPRTREGILAGTVSDNPMLEALEGSARIPGGRNLAGAGQSGAEIEIGVLEQMRELQEHNGQPTVQQNTQQTSFRGQSWSPRRTPPPQRR